MNFSHSAFYELADGAGVAATDSLGNAPNGSIIGTTTNLWANAGCLTIGNAQGAAGDNAIKVVDAYMDAMLRMDDLEGSSIVLMYWVNQPQIPSSGARVICSYGNIAGNTDGAWALYDQTHIPLYSVRGGATWQSPSLVVNEPQTTAENDVWMAYCIQLDVFDGKLAVSSCINGQPNRGLRLFNLEPALPRVDTSGAGLRLLGRGLSGGGSSSFVWGQTKYRRMFIARTNGDQRHMIPVWAKSHYDNATGVPDWMVS